jgi:hypothetical protein
VATSSSTLVSLSSSEEEAEEVFRLNPQQKQEREDRKVQRLVLLAKQQRSSDFEADNTEVTCQRVTKSSLRRPSQELIIPAVSVKPMLDIPVMVMGKEGPVDTDTCIPWMEAEVEGENSTSSILVSTCTPVSLKRDSASFESDETRRISNKSRMLPWSHPLTLARDLEVAFSGFERSPIPPAEAPSVKTKSFWTRKSTWAAIVAILLLVIAIVSLSMVFVGQKHTNVGNQDHNKVTTTASFSPTTSPSAAKNKLPKNSSPSHLTQQKTSRSPTFSPTVVPSRVPSFMPTISFSAWGQLGQSIEGTQDRELLGSSLALSRTGRVLVVGARNFTVGNASQVGRLQAFQWNESRWIPRGQVLLGVGPVSHFGFAVALNTEGTVLAVSEPTLGTGSLYRSGSVRIFQWNDARSVWIGIGQISGLDTFDYFGFSLALSGDGTRLVVGSPYHASNRGQVRIFDYNGTAWHLLTSLDGSSNTDWFGWDVASSEDGKLACIGSPHNKNHGGYVRCFKQSANGTSLSQVGDDIINDVVGETESSFDDFFGNSVSISTWNGGHYVAIGAPFKSVKGTKVGLAAVYQLQESQVNAVVRQYYSLVGSPIFGKAANDQLGFVVRLLNGHLLVSSPGSQGEKGQVGFYRWTGTDWQSGSTPIAAEINSSSKQDFGYALGFAQPDNQTFLMAVGAPLAAQPSSSSQQSGIGAAQVFIGVRL